LAASSLVSHRVRGRPLAGKKTLTMPRRKKVDAKTRSKWAHALMFAAEYNWPSEPLEDFLRHHGGINLCAAKLSRLSQTQT
jgi:hypothetical protein